MNIGAVISDAVEFLSASIPQEIRIHAHVINREAQVMANATQISQLLLNLATKLIAV